MVSFTICVEVMGRVGAQKNEMKRKEGIQPQ